MQFHRKRYGSDRRLFRFKKYQESKMYRYFSGTQEIQKESILETCGAAPMQISQGVDENENELFTVNPSRMEAGYIIATAEERAKLNKGAAIPFTVAGTVYKVVCK